MKLNTYGKRGNVDQFLLTGDYLTTKGLKIVRIQEMEVKRTQK
ncbi:unnamed protein product [Larinioides sclopetarius]|uniref:Uncharacterized protein n=1 Tax=Larinioides sclopetarius TaxID=280406 RepID=A0AAV1ZQ83_9ARAC